MPRIAVVDGVRIELYPNEHPPPHFHAVYAEYRAVFDLDSLKLVRGALPVSKERAVRDWAFPRRVQLLRCWASLREGRKPWAIE